MPHLPGLKTSGRFFTFATAEELFGKLPAARVNALSASATGDRARSARDRRCAGGFAVTPADEGACAAYLIEARDLVARQQRS